LVAEFVTVRHFNLRFLPISSAIRENPYSHMTSDFMHVKVAGFHCFNDEKK